MSKPTEHIDCRPEELTLFHYDELDAEGRRRLEAHLQDCAACRKELTQLRATLEILPKESPQVPPEQIRAFNERLGRRLRPKRSRPLRPALGWSLAAATAVLLLVTVRSPGPGPRQPAPDAARHAAVTAEQMPDAELLLNMELLEHLDMLQELEAAGVNG